MSMSGETVPKPGRIRGHLRRTGSKVKFNNILFPFQKIKRRDVWQRVFYENGIRKNDQQGMQHRPAGNTALRGTTKPVTHPITVGIRGKTKEARNANISGLLRSRSGSEANTALWQTQRSSKTRCNGKHSAAENTDQTCTTISRERGNQ